MHQSLFRQGKGGGQTPSPVKVSLVIPVYNGEPYLRECLDSVMAQDYQDMEILMIDDGSTDGSTALLEEYAARDRRMRWWKNPHNLGLSANFNACLRAARGEYVKFVLQDDKLLSPAAVRLMAERLDADESIALVGTASQLLDAKSQVTGTRDYFKAGRLNGWKVIRRCLERPVNLIGEPTLLMFRRALAGRGFDERYRQMVDFEMWIHLLTQGNFGYFSEPLCAFRQHDTQATVVNRRRIPSGTEEFMLYEGCHRQPWFRRVFDSRTLFANLEYFRHLRDPGWRELEVKWRQSLGRGWQTTFYLKLKITRPFTNLQRSIAKRRARWFA